MSVPTISRIQPCSGPAGSGIVPSSNPTATLDQAVTPVAGTLAQIRFLGTLTGSIPHTATVYLYRGGVNQWVYAHAHKSPAGEQLVAYVDYMAGPVEFQTGDYWRYDASNYFTIDCDTFPPQYLRGRWAVDPTARARGVFSHCIQPIFDNAFSHDGKSYFVASFAPAIGDSVKVTFWVRVPAAFAGIHSTKMFCIQSGIHDNYQQDNWIVIGHEPDNEQFYSFVQTDGDPDYANQTSGVGSAPWPYDEWVKISVELVWNTDRSTKNGIIRVWMNDVLKWEKTDVWLLAKIPPTDDERVFRQLFLFHHFRLEGLTDYYVPDGDYQVDLDQLLVEDLSSTDSVTRLDEGFDDQVPGTVENVLITGTGFDASTKVLIGGELAFVSDYDATTIRITTPTGSAGAADVVVTNNDGSDTLAGGYTFVNPPTDGGATIPLADSILPASGSTAGGTTVTISGSGFKATQGVGTVTFDGVEATAYSSWADDEIVCTTPAHAAGAIDVKVTNSESFFDALPDGFTYSDGATTSRSTSNSTSRTSSKTTSRSTSKTSSRSTSKSTSATQAGETSRTTSHSTSASTSRTQSSRSTSRTTYVPTPTVIDDHFTIDPIGANWRWVTSGDVGYAHDGSTAWRMDDPIDAYPDTGDRIFAAYEGSVPDDQLARGWFKRLNSDNWHFSVLARVAGSTWGVDFRGYRLIWLGSSSYSYLELFRIDVDGSQTGLRYHLSGVPDCPEYCRLELRANGSSLTAKVFNATTGDELFTMTPVTDATYSSGTCGIGLEGGNAANENNDWFDRLAIYDLDAGGGATTSRSTSRSTSKTSSRSTSASTSGSTSASTSKTQSSRSTSASTSRTRSSRSTSRSTSRTSSRSTSASTSGSTSASTSKTQSSRSTSASTSRTQSSRSTSRSTSRTSSRSTSASTSRTQSSRSTSASTSRTQSSRSTSRSTSWTSSRSTSASTSRTQSSRSTSASTSRTRSSRSTSRSTSRTSSRSTSASTSRTQSSRSTSASTSRTQSSRSTSRSTSRTSSRSTSASTSRTRSSRSTSRSTSRTSSRSTSASTSKTQSSQSTSRSTSASTSRTRSSRSTSHSTSRTSSRSTSASTSRTQSSRSTSHSTSMSSSRSTSKSTSRTRSSRSTSCSTSRTSSRSTSASTSRTQSSRSTSRSTSASTSRTQSSRSTSRSTSRTSSQSTSASTSRTQSSRSTSRSTSASTSRTQSSRSTSRSTSRSSSRSTSGSTSRTVAPPCYRLRIAYPRRIIFFRFVGAEIKRR